MGNNTSTKEVPKFHPVNTVTVKKNVVKKNIHLKLQSCEWNQSDGLSKTLEVLHVIRNIAQSECILDSDVPSGSSSEHGVKVQQCIATISRLIKEDKIHDAKYEFEWYIQFLKDWCNTKHRHTLIQTWILSDHTDFRNKFRHKYHSKSVLQKSQVIDVSLGYFSDSHTFCTNWPSVGKVIQNCQLEINIDNNLFNIHIMHSDGSVYGSVDPVSLRMEIGCDNIRHEISMDVGSNRLVIGIYRPPLMYIKVNIYLNSCLVLHANYCVF